jgi:LysR family transcriptional regulator, hydrogen peroxide-inducible genes activator
LELSQVRYFLAVCETRNVTRAAELCRVAQPSLTRAIKRLEEELGGALFRRGRQGTVPTELGLRMRPHLEQSLAALENAREEAQGYAAMEQATLRLGVMCTIGPARPASLLARLRARVPSLDLRLEEVPGPALAERLAAGTVDVALSALARAPAELHCWPLYRERFVVAFPPGHRFERLAAVPLRELTGERYLQRVNCEFEDHFAALGLPDPVGDLPVCFRSEREEWVQSMVMAGMGVAIMPEHLALVPGLPTRVLTEPEVWREVRLLALPGRRFTVPVEAFVRLARAHDWAADAPVARAPRAA